jgi:hypothetical protein
MPATELTKSQKSALLWFRNRGGDGMFNYNGTLVAAGQLAPVMRSTWNILRDQGLLESYSRLRLRVTEAGQTINLSDVEESHY